jgi:hypothetical protein
MAAAAASPAVRARTPSKANLEWGRRTTVDENASSFMNSLLVGAFDSSTMHKAFNVEVSPGKRALIESPVITVPWGASWESKDKQTGKVIEQNKVEFKANVDTDTPAQASFAEFLGNLDEWAKAKVFENYAKMTRDNDANDPDDEKKIGIKKGFKNPTVKQNVDKQGNLRQPQIKFRVMTRAADKATGEKPDHRDVKNWLVDVYKVNDDGRMEQASPAELMNRGLTVKVMFDVRVTNSNIGYTIALTARSVKILDQKTTGVDLEAMFAEDEDVQEAKRRKMEAKSASPPADAHAAPAIDTAAPAAPYESKSDDNEVPPGDDGY